MNLQELNEKYAIQDELIFQQGNGDLPMIKIENGRANALISIYAGQVLSFVPKGEQEDLLFVSRNAYYQAGKAIKGGVPVCWPWFGPDPDNKGRPAHGFVRNRMWSVLNTRRTEHGDTEIQLGVTDDEETRRIWPYSFELMMVITVGYSLSLELVTRNTDDQAFSITQALHTYFRIGDIDEVSVQGLEDTEYLDKVDGGIKKRQDGEVDIAHEVDRIYLDVPGDLLIGDPALNRKISIHSAGNKTAVVWNPWIKICTEMADLEDEDYRNFICVETTNAASDIVEIPPGGQFSLSAKYRIEKY